MRCNGQCSKSQCSKSCAPSEALTGSSRIFQAQRMKQILLLVSLCWSVCHILPPQIDDKDLSVNPTGTKRRLHSTRCWVSGRLFANGRLELARQVKSGRFVSCETHVNWLIQSETDCSLHVEGKPHLSVRTGLSTSASSQDSKHWSKSFQ